jgi:UDP-glucuronate 4-epimerase
MPNSILITGGAGFIGSHLVECLLEMGHYVTVIDNFNNFYSPQIKQGNIKNCLDHDFFNLIDGDIRDSEAVERAFYSPGCDEVIHLAAMAGVRPSVENPYLYQDVNLIGTANILEACRKFEVNKLILASSSSVYGNNKKVPFSEEDRVDHPASPYAATKRATELMASTYHNLYNLRIACLRFFTVYGPRQRPEMATYLFTEAILNNREITVFGDGQSRRDYTYISDIIDGITSCRDIEFGYDIFNLGRSDTIKLLDLVGKLEKILNKKAKIRNLPTQPGDVEQTFADISKARDRFGFNPRISIDEGLTRFVEWYLKRQESK